MIARMLVVAACCVGVTLTSVGCSAEIDDSEASGEEGQNADESAEALSGSFAVGTDLQTTADLNHREAPSPSADVLQVIPRGTIVKSASASPRANWYGVTWNGKTGWVSGQYLSKPTSGGGGAVPGTNCADASRVIGISTPALETIGNCTVAAGAMANALRCLVRKYPGARCNGPRSSFRSTAIQKQLVCELGCYSAARGSGAACDSVSNHQRGEAVDLNGDYDNNGCGLLRKVSGEPWHYSLTGR